MPGKHRGPSHLVRYNPSPLFAILLNYHVISSIQGQHEAYWSRYPGKYEHWRFSEGFVQGWDDAYAFFTSANGHVVPSELGFKGAWSKMRERAHVANRGSGSCVWEYSKTSLFCVAFRSTLAHFIEHRHSLYSRTRVHPRSQCG